MAPSPSSTGTVLGDLRMMGKTLAGMSREKLQRYLMASESAQIAAGYSDRTRQMVLLETVFASSWVAHGAIVYELTHDIASLFAVTSSPPLDWTRAPHPMFVVKVPRDLLPVTETSIDSNETYLLVAKNGIMVIADCDTTAEAFVGFDDVMSNPEQVRMRVVTAINDQTKLTSTLAMRYVANLIAYVAEYRDRVEPRGRATAKARSMLVVRPPRDVLITREFRDAAYASVSAGSLAGIRRALAHVVRGHWRNQPVGVGRTDRRLTWVRPHKRGEESLGSVVSRVEKVVTRSPR